MPGSPTCRSPRAVSKRPRASRKCKRRAPKFRPSSSRAAPSHRASRARGGARTSSATPTLRAACREAIRTRVTAQFSICRSPRVSPPRSAVPNSSPSRSQSPRSLVTRWKSICSDCAGSIDSVVELLQGRLAKGVMERVCRQGEGLFPGPKEIKLSCSCPDWADMCKQVAATLYGVCPRFDKQPELLFALRQEHDRGRRHAAGDAEACCHRKEGAGGRQYGRAVWPRDGEGEAPPAAGAGAVVPPRQVGGRVEPKAAATPKTPEKRHPTSARPPAVPPPASGPKSKGPDKGTAQIQPLARRPRAGAWQWRDPKPAPVA